MAHLSSGPMRVLAILLALLSVGLFVAFWRHGRAVEEGITITGQPRLASSTPVLPPPPSSAVSSPVPASPLPALESNSPPAPAAQEMVVHVAGAVKRPGVYHLPPGSRADDAIRAAGGAKSDAHLDAINLAVRLEDGVQLYVPTRSEQPNGGAAGSAAYLKTGSAKPAPAQGRTASPSSRSSKLSRPGEGTVNINTADAEELQRLPGIGPSYAARIIQFRRENGPFTSPEQLMDVSGIGEKKYERMRPFVRLR